MTILVGVRCTDGVVIGVDSVATSAHGPNPLVQILSNDKLQKIGNRGLLACTGSVGLAQRVKLIADTMWTGKEFKGNPMDCACKLANGALQNFQSTGVQRHPHHGIGFGALLAMAIDDNAELVEFGTTDFQPELKQGKLFAVSMGSGQVLADPFLAFVSRVLWNNSVPDVKLAKAGVFWVLDHTIKYAPGGVGEPIKLGVLQRIRGDWKTEILEDTQEQSQFIAALERKIGPELAMEDAEATNPPELGGGDLPAK